MQINCRRPGNEHAAQLPIQRLFVIVLIIANSRTKIDTYQTSICPNCLVLIELPKDAAMKNILVPALTGAGVLAIIASAAAQTPVAVVERVKGRVADVEFMDYVTPGTKIELGPTGSIVLSYTQSCRREIITGGTVIVGSEQSTVDHGKVEHTIVGCDANHIRLVAAETSQSAATVFRNISPTRPAQSTPQITLYGRSPVVETNGPGTLVIERLDRPGERHEVALSDQSLERGRFYDFAKAHQALTPGATYVASLGRLSVVFKIDRRAKRGSTPIIGRLLRFVAAP
jgi:hypothetical protein